jgi:hypothetical protein
MAPPRRAALIVAKGDMTVNVQDVEQFIEERRQKAEMLIAKMREEPAPADATGKPWEGSGTA